jgi:sulfur transfer protein SufE
MEQNLNIEEAVKFLIDNADGRYDGVSNYGKPKKEYIKKVVTQNDEELEKECESTIWLSAYANNNSRSDYHWQVNVCYEECKRRKKPGLYARAYKYVSEG